MIAAPGTEQRTSSDEAMDKQQAAPQCKVLATYHVKDFQQINVV